MDYQFQKGQAYIGTATIDNRRQKVFVVAGRTGDQVSFAHVKDVKRERVDWCQETEVVKIKDDDGFDYFMSARVPCDVDESFHVVGLCR